MNGIVKGMVFVTLAAFALSGCGTAQKKRDEEMKGIKTQLDTLQFKVDSIEIKQGEAERMAAERAQGNEEAATSNIDIKPRSGKGKERTKNIQAALKSAGFYNGAIDGVKGRKTRKAIREFQKANGLVPDGVVGKKTWELLSGHSEAPNSAGEASK